MNDLKEEILDHYKYPRNFGDMEDATHRAKQGNSSCGDRVEFFLKVKDNVIEKVSWQGQGCAISTAVASMLSEEAKGKSLEDIKEWDERKVFSLVGEINEGRVGCAILPLKTIKNVLG